MKLSHDCIKASEVFFFPIPITFFPSSLSFIAKGVKSLSLETIAYISYA
jgi:hypothetical protein